MSEKVESGKWKVEADPASTSTRDCNSLVLDRNGVRYDPKKKPEGLEVFNGRTWWDMPGRQQSHDVAKMNFALYKRGLIELHECEDIEDPKQRRMEQRYQRSLEAKRQRGNGGFIPMHEAGLAGYDSDATKGRVVAETEDDMAEVKARSRAALGFPPLPAEPAEAGSRKPKVEVMKKQYNQTTTEQRAALLDKINQVSAKLGVPRTSLLRAMGLTGSYSFATPSGVKHGDERWEVVAAKLPRVESGEIAVEPDRRGEHLKKVRGEKLKDESGKLKVLPPRRSVEEFSRARLAPVTAADNEEEIIRRMQRHAEEIERARQAMRECAKELARLLISRGEVAA